MNKYFVISVVILLLAGLWMGLKKAPSDLSSARIYFFYGSTFEESKNFTLDQAVDIVNHPEFDFSKPTVLYCHGYVETMEVESIRVIVNAYLLRNDHNILILDWAQLAEGNYLLDAVQNMRQFAPVLSRTILQLFEAGMEVNKFHLIGHSLGGQLSGTVGRTIYKETNKSIKLKRITALDPAFPGFYPPIAKAISSSDAAFVDIIHTDAWLYGAPVSTGTVDFWPNGGKSLQPGCPKRNYQMLTDNDLCSHRRSWRFWAESVAAGSRKTFNAVKCKSWNNFKLGKIQTLDIPIHMGIDCDPSLKGDFFLQTNGEAPFSKDHAGMTYEEPPAKK